MTTSADINPSYITAAAVSKQETRNQFQYVKDAIAAVEGYNGWKRLSTQTIVTPALDVRCNMPTGYSAYRIEISNIQLASSGQLFYRGSNDNVTYATTNYDGVCSDTSSASVATFNTGSGSVALTANVNNVPPLITGILEFDTPRNTCFFRTHFVQAAGSIRILRNGACAHSVAALWVQFFITGGAIAMNSGTFTVLARP